MAARVHYKKQFTTKTACGRGYKHGGQTATTFRKEQVTCPTCLRRIGSKSAAFGEGSTVKIRISDLKCILRESVGGYDIDDVGLQLQQSVEHDSSLLGRYMSPDEVADELSLPWDSVVEWVESLSPYDPAFEIYYANATGPLLVIPDEL